MKISFTTFGIYVQVYTCKVLFSPNAVTLRNIDYKCLKNFFKYKFILLGNTLNILFLLYSLLLSNNQLDDTDYQ